MDLKKESKDKIKQRIKSIINPKKGILVNFKFIARMEKEKKLYRLEIFMVMKILK